MRQRKPKNLAEKLLEHEKLFVDNAEAAKGSWRNLFPCAVSGKDTREARLFLEIGTGKGGFLLEKARRDEDGLFLGFEGRDSIILRAAEKADSSGLANVLFSRQYVRDLRPIFEGGELNGLFLNFSDPWPKGRHSGRRLTNRTYLSMYKDVLRPGALIEFKTDSEDFFLFSRAEFESMDGMDIVEINEDLHGSSLPAAAGSELFGRHAEAVAVLTEYEERFVRWNRRIFYICACVRQ